MIKANLGLGEPDGRLFVLGQCSIAGQQAAVVVEHVAESDIMVVDHVMRAEAIVRGMFGLDTRQKHFALHNVVDRREHEHGRNALRHGKPLARVLEKVSEFVPGDIGTKGVLLLHRIHRKEAQLCVGSHGAGPRSALWSLSGWLIDASAKDIPLIVNAEGKTVLSVNADAHEPIKGEERSHRALVFGAVLQVRCIGLGPGPQRRLTGGS
eukprot:scaffold7514_cov115-Isochrysis_galbana.AAC.2